MCYIFKEVSSCEWDLGRSSLWKSCYNNKTVSCPSSGPSMFSVLLLNQSSRVYDCEQDASYLMGIDPTTANPTNALLGPLLGSYNGYECSVVNSMPGSTISWSALYLR